MVTANDLQLLNNRVAAVSPSDSNGLSITLSTRRDTVDYINQCQLDKLPGEASVFYGDIKGDFPESSLPTPMQLDLSVFICFIFENACVF